ncbi:UDP-3-O-[3-hydroxymyristoyl] glucosamine N-acyltransferase [hydrothermal vent metagenome]|uniref:UDP-3-O-[3-hydroxymyristoyl] glucosamine N-acyltransferase n=1 Tax=hydrothermal vent metagenome TaxID=652676 RepID=A0A3B0ZPA8_9ZZZZ
MKTLAELSLHVDGRVEGDAGLSISSVAALESAGDGAITFVANSQYRDHLSETQASAVILGATDVAFCPVSSIVVDNPYLAYAKIASLLYPRVVPEGSIHPTAVVAASANVSDSAFIAQNAVIGEQVEIAAGVVIGPGSVIADHCYIGKNTTLFANVTLCESVVVGDRVIIHPGAVLGADGFGLANDKGVWIKIPQLGSVRIGNDVEIGANTTIDRGALNDTIIEDGVKLDNLIQIAHNVVIGEHTVIAGCTGIAGSTKIGRHCALAGGIGIAGHIDIADNVQITGMSMVTKSIVEAGVYSSGMPLQDNLKWRKTASLLKQLNRMQKRIKQLEKNNQRNIN